MLLALVLAMPACVHEGRPDPVTAGDTRPEQTLVYHGRVGGGARPSLWLEYGLTAEPRWQVVHDTFSDEHVSSTGSGRSWGIARTGRTGASSVPKSRS